MASVSAKRHYGASWTVDEIRDAKGEVSLSPGQLQLLLLQEIRDELQSLNRLLHCPNFIAIPAKLDAIKRKLPAPKKRRKA